MKKIYAYKNQSTAKISPMSFTGRFTACRTSTMVTRPACGMPAAPIDAAVAVKLKREEDVHRCIFLARLTDKGRSRERSRGCAPHPEMTCSFLTYSKKNNNLHDVEIIS